MVSMVIARIVAEAKIAETLHCSAVQIGDITLYGNIYVQPTSIGARLSGLPGKLEVLAHALCSHRNRNPFGARA